MGEFRSPSHERWAEIPWPRWDRSTGGKGICIYSGESFSGTNLVRSAMAFCEVVRSFLPALSVLCVAP